MTNFDITKYFKKQYLAEALDLNKYDKITDQYKKELKSMGVDYNAYISMRDYSQEGRSEGDKYLGKGFGDIHFIYKDELPNDDWQKSIKFLKDKGYEITSDSNYYEVEWDNDRAWHPKIKFEFDITKAEELLESKKHLKEITQSGMEGVYPMSERPGDMFQQKEVEELLPIGMASRDDKALKDRLAKHAEWTEQSGYNNTFIHFQYHELTDVNGNDYFIHQSQHYNHNYDDFRSPRFTEISITKNYQKDNEEDLGKYIVSTPAYIDDIKRMEDEGIEMRRSMEEGKKKLNELHQKAADLVDGYELEDLERNLEQIYRDMEQEAEPEGGPIADQYADEIYFHEEAINFIKRKGKEQAQLTYDQAIGREEITDETGTYTMGKGGVKNYIKINPMTRNEFEKSSKFDVEEGSCGYSVDGEKKDKPAGPHLIKLERMIKEIYSNQLKGKNNKK